MPQPNARPSTSAELPPVNFDKLLEQFMESTALVEKATHLIAAQCDVDVERIAEGVRSGDAAAVRDAAHSLKGAAAYFAADDVRSCAARLEALGKAGDLVHASEALEQLRAECHRLVGYLPQVRVQAAARD